MIPTKFKVIIAKTPDDFKPTNWQDNPEKAVFLVIARGDINIATANELARGFNESEMLKPVHMWAFVVDNNFIKIAPGSILKIRTYNQPNVQS